MSPPRQQYCCEDPSDCARVLVGFTTRMFAGVCCVPVSFFPQCMYVLPSFLQSSPDQDTDSTYARREGLSVAVRVRVWGLGSQARKPREAQQRQTGGWLL